MAFTTDPRAYVDLSQETPVGTVTSVSVATANGLAGTVATPSTAPVITLSTTITGLLKGNGTALSAAANIDLPAMSSTVGGAVPTPPNNTTTFLRGDGTFAAPSSGISVVNGWINGFTLSNDAGTPNTILDIAAGYAADSTNATMITGTAFTKTTGGAWAAGTGNAGMGTGLTIANSTWYHVFAIINAGNYDVYFDTSATAANKPASTTAFRYIGSFKTDGSAHIIAFFQFGQQFLWAASVADISAGGTLSAALYTLTVPLGFVTMPLMMTSTGGGAGNHSLWSAALGSGYTATPIFTGSASSYIPQPPAYQTNTSSQIYAKVSSINTLNLVTIGYINPHVAAVY